jgi:hypothetical protein
MIPVFIPSRGRSKTSKFCNEMKNSEREFYIFIYEDEYDDYVKEFLPINLIKVTGRKGIAPKRQFMLEEARRKGLTWFWMIDDDVHTFYRRSNTKEKISADIFLKEMEEYIDDSVVQIGPKKGCFGLQKASFNKNTCLAEIILLNAEKTVDYDINMVALEDTDLIIRNFIKGNDNMKVNDYIFYSPKSGKSGKGGLDDVYKNCGKKTGMLQFQAKHPKLIKIETEDGERYRINWKRALSLDDCG